jgi:hypothetical protein
METAPPDAFTASAVDAPTPPRPRFGRALLALAAAATIAVAPVAGTALAPADSGASAHSIPVYLFARLSHDIGHNDWAFQGENDGRVEWGVCYLVLGLFWLGVTLWVRARARRHDGDRGLWWRMLLAAWIVEAVLGGATIGAGLLAAWNSWPPDAFLLHASDLCSPWWSCVAVALVAGRREHSGVVLRAALGYAVLLAVVLVVPLPFPDAIKALILAVPAAVPAFMAMPPSEAGGAAAEAAEVALM